MKTSTLFACCYAAAHSSDLSLERVITLFVFLIVELIERLALGVEEDVDMLRLVAVDRVGEVNVEARIDVALIVGWAAGADLDVAVSGLNVLELLDQLRDVHW